MYPLVKPPRHPKGETQLKVKWIYWKIIILQRKKEKRIKKKSKATTRSYMTSSRSQRESNYRARDSGQIIWTHCPMLNPPYFTLSMVCNLLLSSSHSDVLFGKVGCWRKRRLLSLNDSPASSPARGCLPCHPAIAYPQRCFTEWGSECPLSMLILNLHSFLV